MKVKINERTLTSNYPFESINSKEVKLRKKYIYIPLDWKEFSKNTRCTLACRSNKILGDDLIDPDEYNWCGLFIRCVKEGPFLFDFNAVYLSYNDFYIEDVSIDLYNELIEKGDTDNNLIVPVELSEKEKLGLMCKLYMDNCA